MIPSDATLYTLGCVVLAVLLVGFGLAFVVRRLAASRPGLALGAPVAAGVSLRLVSFAMVSAAGLGQSLRGGDEALFVTRASEVAQTGFLSGEWFPTRAHRLHELVFAFQIKVADFPDAALRVTQVGLAMLGIVLIVAAIYDAAGARAGVLGAWLLALEPASVFFNSLLHRESLLLFAGGLVVFGGSKVWSKLDLSGVALLGLGCTIAVATRPYAGWFLITGALLLILHAALRQATTQLRSVPLVYAVVIVVAATTPAVLNVTSPESLEQNLQRSQNANTDPDRGGNSNNLALEEVDFSSRSDLVTNLPQRIRDVTLRPYPWQLANSSQQLGAFGSLVALTVLFLLFRYGIRNRGRILAISAPLLYPTLFLLVAYALSVGNAGTGFRYRTHLVTLALGVLVVWREHALATRAKPATLEATPDAGRHLKQRKRHVTA